MPKVYNKRDENTPADAVYVGRPTKFGNPFPMGGPSYYSREEVVAKYRTYLLTNFSLMKQVRAELAGKDLVCWCAPEACHADILLKVANEITDE